VAGRKNRRVEPLEKQKERRHALKTFFITPGKLHPGIKNSSKNGTLLIGDRGICSTLLCLHEVLQGKEILTDVAVRSFGNRRSRYRKPGPRFSTIIPSSGNDDRALILVVFPAETSYGRWTWRSIRAPESEERSWLEANGMALNTLLLWDGIYQDAYGQYLDDYGRDVVRRLLSLEARNGLRMRNGEWGLCIYWNGYHLDKTEMMPLRELRERLSAVL
jgi:hypothetical protein